jgi:23S rRNA (adenine2503-C2)-methyltransferase
VLYFARYLKNERQEEKSDAMVRVNNIVFMGMGEPLANYESLIQAIALLNAPEGFGLGARNMTVSTAGLVPQIERFTQEKLQVGLAVSLHASDNKLRDRLVPVNRRYPLEQLMAACREYGRVTGRRLSYEYILLKGINDAPAQARSLAGLLRGMNCHVNLIPANDTGDRTFRPPGKGEVLAFEREVRRSGINATLRQPRGQDINAGCGQLRSRYRQGKMKQGRRAPATGE